MICPTATVRWKKVIITLFLKQVLLCFFQFYVIKYLLYYIYKAFFWCFKIEKQGKFVTILSVIVSFKNGITELDDQDKDFSSQF
jgi:hypothetical protein